MSALTQHRHQSHWADCKAQDRLVPRALETRLLAKLVVAAAAPSLGDLPLVSAEAAELLDARAVDKFACRPRQVLLQVPGRSSGPLRCRLSLTPLRPLGLAADMAAYEQSLPRSPGVLPRR